jgi:NAD(P)H-hydrate repair Nnr-like enzyme with NAD(P)H-hydrate epimerase domain
MTTQEKTDAIQKIVTNHSDNVIAAQAANVSVGLNALVIEAMNDAFKADLTVVFALRSVASGHT